MDTVTYWRIVSGRTSSCRQNHKPHNHRRTCRIADHSYYCRTLPDSWQSMCNLHKLFESKVFLNTKMHSYSSQVTLLGLSWTYITLLLLLVRLRTFMGSLPGVFLVLLAVFVGPPAVRFQVDLVELHPNVVPGLPVHVRNFYPDKKNPKQPMSLMEQTKTMYWSLWRPSKASDNVKNIENLEIAWPETPSLEPLTC